MDVISRLKVRISNVHERYDGEYELDLETLKNKDTHLIKQVSGLRPAEYGDAMATLDTDFFEALAAVCLQRAGKPVSVDVLREADLGSIQIDPVEEEQPAAAGDALPPAEPTSERPVGEPRSEPDGSGSSGPTSNGSSVRPESFPSRTGPRLSAAAMSAPETSAS